MNRIAILLVCSALISSTPPARADENETSEWLSRRGHEILLGFGSFDVGDPDEEPVITAEFHFEQRWWLLSPFVGGRWVTDGPLYGYAGLETDLDLGSGLELTPSLAVGLYDRNGGIDLGGTVQFRSALLLSYRIGSAMRLGLGFDHVSNAGLYDHNPGANTLMLSLSFELGWDGGGT